MADGYAILTMSNKHTPSPEWSRAKQIRVRFGLTSPQLTRYAAEGLIRTSAVRRPGQSRGIRLFHVGDIERLITSSIESRSEDTSM